MDLVGLTGVRRADHVDVGHVGIVGLDVALQFVEKRAMRLGWVGERLRSACLRHPENYADVFVIAQPEVLPCRARRFSHSPRRRGKPITEDAKTPANAACSNGASPA